MNPDQLKQIINFDYQLMTFALGMHQFFQPLSEKGSKLSGELIDLAQKFGQYVAMERLTALTPIIPEVVN
jgi:hypothetical protein